MLDWTLGGEFAALIGYAPEGSPVIERGFQYESGSGTRLDLNGSSSAVPKARSSILRFKSFISVASSVVGGCPRVSIASSMSASLRYTRSRSRLRSVRKGGGGIRTPTCCLSDSMPTEKHWILVILCGIVRASRGSSRAGPQNAFQAVFSIPLEMDSKNNWLTGLSTFSCRTMYALNNSSWGPVQLELL